VKYKYFGNYIIHLAIDLRKDYENNLIFGHYSILVSRTFKQSFNPIWLSGPTKMLRFDRLIEVSMLTAFVLAHLIPASVMHWPGSQKNGK
jgi:hypothetical protein